MIKLKETLFGYEKWFSDKIRQNRKNLEEKLKISSKK